VRHPVLAGLLAIPLGLFLIWTWLRLWRPATDAFSKTVYRYGLKGFGLISFAWTLVDQAGVSTKSPLSRLYGVVLVILPISLWGGYVFGRAMAWVFGQEPTSSPPAA